MASHERAANFCRIADEGTGSELDINHNASNLQRSPPKNDGLWQENGGGAGKIFGTFFRVFSLFWDFARRKPLRGNEKRWPNPSKKIVPENLRWVFRFLGSVT